MLLYNLLVQVVKAGQSVQPVLDVSHLEEQLTMHQEYHIKYFSISHPHHLKLKFYQGQS